MKMAGILLIYILGIYFLLTKMVQLEDEAVVGVKKTHKELSETTHSSNEKAIQYVASNMIKEAPKIAITFDDGPSPAWTPKLLDGLKERNVKATFFLIGENAENTPELVKRESEEGHLVGNLICRCSFRIDCHTQMQIFFQQIDLSIIDRISYTCNRMSGA